MSIGCFVFWLVEVFSRSKLTKTGLVAANDLRRVQNSLREAGRPSNSKENLNFRGRGGEGLNASLSPKESFRVLFAWQHVN